MKKITSLFEVLALVALALFIALPASAALDDPINGFAVGTTNPATTLSYAIVPARSANAGTPVVHYVNAGSATATAKLQFYKVTAQTVCSATNSTVTLNVNRTNSFNSGDVIIIQHLLNNTYEKRTLTTMSYSTNLVCTVAPVGTVVPGDIIYKASTSGAGSIQWGAVTNSVGPAAYIYVGQKNKPLLVEIDGASTTALVNVISGSYLP